MNVESVKRRSDVTEIQCSLCGKPVPSGELCEVCEHRGLSPEQYAEFFWEEA